MPPSHVLTFMEHAKITEHYIGIVKFEQYHFHELGSVADYEGPVRHPYMGIIRSRDFSDITRVREVFGNDDRYRTEVTRIEHRTPLYEAIANDATGSKPAMLRLMLERWWMTGVAAVNEELLDNLMRTAVLHGRYSAMLVLRDFRTVQPALIEYARSFSPSRIHLLDMV